ncbi:peptidoglycan bridge formation glycyltransferase FemA/FemB family protein [Erysipelotrichaceae bacterium 66-17]
MSNYEFTTQISQDEYDGFVRNHPNANLLQSWNWARIKSNWDHVYTAVKKDGQIEAAALVLIKNLPAGFTMLYIPRGPVMDWSDQKLLDFYMKNLKKEAKKHRALFVKMDPPVVIGEYFSQDPEHPRNGCEALVENFRKAGCIHQGFTMMIEDSIQPRFQSVVYRTDDLDGSLPKHTKRLIKDADKRHVQIIHGGRELLDEFSRLVELTEKRKGVALRNREYFDHLLEVYKDDAVIFLAKCNLRQLHDEASAKINALEKELEETPVNAKKKKNRLNDQLNSARKSLAEYEQMIKDGMPEGDVAIAGILSVQYGNTCEMLYAGMDERFKQFMPQYKEYVENFRWAFERGCRLANMGGVEGTFDDGLTRFKDNFAPTIVEFIGEFDLPVLFYKPAKMLYEKKRHSMRES